MSWQGRICLLMQLIFSYTLLAKEPELCVTTGLEQTDYVLALHEKNVRRKLVSERKVPVSREGNIAIVTGNSRSLIRRSLFDLKGKKISFIRNASGTYDVRLSSGAFPKKQGKLLPLQNYVSKEIGFHPEFHFPFYSKLYGSVHVSPSGYLTFGESDNSDSPLNMFRALTGPPRISPFGHSLYTEGAGKVKVLKTAGQFSITWLVVSEGLYATHENTFRVDLFRNGNIDFTYSNQMDWPFAVVGISPGTTTTRGLKLVDFSVQQSIKNEKGAILEQFAMKDDIDLALLIQEFHRAYPPKFDFVWVFTDFDTNMPGVAYYTSIQNDIQGIGRTLHNYSASFGSPRIQGFIMMGNVSTFPVEPTIDFRPSINLVELIGHENGHRWLAFPKISLNGSKTNDLLGRQLGHWNFYMDSDASVMEGNDIREQGGGNFTTVSIYERYSKLDLYLMGMIPPQAVPPFFFVRVPHGVNSLPPQVGIDFSGTKVDVSVDDIIAAEGPRIPTNSASPKRFRGAIILFRKPASGSPNPVHLQLLEKLRIQYQLWFKEQTNQMGTIDLSLP